MRSSKNFKRIHSPNTKWSFLIIHKAGNVGIFVLHEFDHKLDVVISRINLISKHYDKSKFVLKFIQLIKIPN